MCVSGDLIVLFTEAEDDKLSSQCLGVKGFSYIVVYEIYLDFKISKEYKEIYAQD